ncbi:alpha/beta fold hydrolase [Hymenobacter sp. DG25A]|uniref:alpha/beta fold hydrolase n=1 Tax=Hymenobacter sp. DG25A TaxID=1385663 RepID=UPI0006BD48FB|nr:alpha/beta fold hydrolase [Hymenobacter sp. DG25A]ALD22273.1 hypothetical protein AM218_14945 [Hymenobacter sp. DG25A]
MMYLIPGLGADERVFRNLLPLLRSPVKVLPWLTPLQQESLPHYVARIAELVDSTQPCLVVGVSFGGVVALELCRLRPLAEAVLISSIPDAGCLPLSLRAIRASGVYKLVPPQLLKLFPRAGQWYFGVRNGEEYRLFKEILGDMEPRYTRWAIDRLLHWDSTDTGRCLQILGTKDRVFPPGPAPVDYLIQGGGHFMILSHALEISHILNRLAEAQATGTNAEAPVPISL